MQKHQVDHDHSPAYSFMEILEMADVIQNWPDMSVLIDVIEMDQAGYNTAQQSSIGLKLQERYIELIYGVK